MEESSELSSHKGRKRSFTMQFKQEVVEFASEHSNRSAAQRFNVEQKRVREWKDNFDKIKTAKSSRQKLEGGASRGWCENFMRRHWFSLKRKTTTAQKRPLLSRGLLCVLSHACSPIAKATFICTFRYSSDG